MDNVKDDAGSYSIAIIGCGPRGISVVERRAVLMNDQQKHIPHKRGYAVHVIDAYEPGAGRIWRQAQPSCLLMNTFANETTMFSGPSDNGPARPGAGIPAEHTRWFMQVGIARPGLWWI